MNIYKTKEYDRWFRKLRDRSAKVRIHSKIQRMKVCGRLLGDCKPIGGQVYEMRFAFGPGYRVYFTLHDNDILLLLIGGDKSTQHIDVEKAKRLAQEWRQ